MKFKLSLLNLVFLCGCSSLPQHLLQEERQRSGVEFVTQTKHLSVSPWDLRYKTLEKKHQGELNHYLKLFSEEFQKLPLDLIQVSGLKTVAFVHLLAIAEQNRAAVPDYNHEVLYYDILAGLAPYLRHVVHHEFYHMLEQQLYGTAYYKDPDWLALNPPNFQYGLGGAATREVSAAKFTHPFPGFVNGYSMSGVEEDKAEIWSLIWTSESWHLVKAMVEKDPILQEKLHLLMQQLQCKAPSLKSAWPHYVKVYAPKDDSCSK